MTLLIVSFLAGMLTVLAPCILPLLPVVIGASSQGRSKYTPYIVVGSLALSIIAFTFILKVSTVFITVPQYFWTYLSGGIIFAFGVTLIFPSVWENISYVSKLSISSNKVLGKGHLKKTMWGDVIVGAALGPIFSTCSPTYFVILASVLPASLLIGTTYLLAYTFGLSLVLLFIALLGEKFTAKLTRVSDGRGWFKRFVGMLFVLLGIAIMFGLEKKFETKLIESDYFDVTTIENKLLEKI